ncbi:MAG: hypothetical protein GXX78_04420 [Bacteroidales bacterium]|nr:hypothetical protein [Bacteroidales bacterium]
MKSRLIILLGMLIYLLFFSSCISLDPTFTDRDNYFSSARKSNDPKIYNGSPSENLLPVFYSKGHLASSYHLYRLALTSFKGDSVYNQIEMHGAAYGNKKSIVLLCYDYKNKMVDIYHPLDLELKAANYVDMLNSAEVHPTEFDASFGADNLGFYMKLNLVDKYGRTIIIDIREDEPNEKSIAFNAPIGADSEHPKNFPFTFIEDVGLARKNCGRYCVSIGEKKMKPTKIPFSPYLMTRYSMKTTIAEWLPETDTPIYVKQQNNSPSVSYNIKDNSGYQELLTETFDYHGRKMHVTYCPPIPDLEALKSNENLEGRFIIDTDSVKGIVAGIYFISKSNGKITIEISPKEGWQPMPGKHWMSTYHWKAELTPEVAGAFHLKSGWKRDK